MSLENLASGMSTSIVDDVKDPQTVTTTLTTPDTPGTPFKMGSIDMRMVELGPDPSTTKEGNSDISPVVSPELERKYRLRGYLQFLANCWTLFLAGWNDGTTGPLLPRIREVYDVCLRSIYFFSLNFVNIVMMGSFLTLWSL